MRKSGKGSKGGLMYEGLKNHSPSSSDKSTVLKGPSVDSGAMRDGTAPTPATLGPRTA